MSLNFFLFFSDLTHTPSNKLDIKTSNMSSNNEDGIDSSKISESGDKRVIFSFVFFYL